MNAYSVTLPQITKMLKNLDSWLAAGVEHAKNKKFDPEVLLAARLQDGGSVEHQIGLELLEQRDGGGGVGDVEPLPRLAAIPRTKHSGLPVDARSRPHRSAVQRDHPNRAFIARMAGHDFPRHHGY